jgi:hypothetical protein
MTPQEIAGNCAAGDSCRCLKKPKPWLCENWGRSQLACPHIISAYSESISPRSLLDARRSLRERQDRFQRWSDRTEEKLRRVRHEDPVKHLAKKGVKVKR